MQIYSLISKLWAKEHLGKAVHIMKFRQVYKARLREGSEYFALKRIKMDNEKEGV